MLWAGLQTSSGTKWPRRSVSMAEAAACLQDWISIETDDAADTRLTDSSGDTGVDSSTRRPE